MRSIRSIDLAAVAVVVLIAIPAGIQLSRPVLVSSIQLPGASLGSGPTDRVAPAAGAQALSQEVGWIYMEPIVKFTA